MQLGNNQYSSSMELGRPKKTRGDSHIKMTGVLVVPFRGKNAVLVPFRVFSFKTSSVVAFVVPLRVEIR